MINTVSNGQAKLVETQKTFRSWGGRGSKCDATIVLPGEYDIGLLKSKDGKSWEPIMESYLMHLPNPIGVNNAPLGLVQQEYALREAEYEAAQRGMSTERVVGDKGRITLRCIAA